ncbi:serine protease inhibitor 77Ba-like [Pieris rapae]|uniref:serine protease inhibitor 77Ba-like n=1 Tax=Pieris rapae TaxID=64459 RepID=UPI001E27D0AB|nr:serine protease inhibitor 77Ba-like [Pieris rapae]
MVNKMNISGSLCVFVLCVCSAYTSVLIPKAANNIKLSERIGNFSVELIDRTLTQSPNSNVVISPITIWTVLAVIAEGSANNTLKEVCHTLRIAPENLRNVRESFKRIEKYLIVKTTTVELNKLNVLFVDKCVSPTEKFELTASDYDVSFAALNFSEPYKTANIVNSKVYNFTQGKISDLISGDDLTNSHMILTSALYFKGQWTFKFNKSTSTKAPFFDNQGNVIGQVKMMYNRQILPFANFKDLKARIIELPYGKENRLSMLVMLPYQNVTVNEMFLNLNRMSLNHILASLAKSLNEFPEDEIDIYLPRFKVETHLDLTDTLKSMGIKDLFDYSRSNLKNMVKIPSFVSKVAHKAVIEVTEEGTTAAAAAAAAFSYRIGVTKFEANRPFGYIIVEKTTNTIPFAGSYNIPELYES